MNTEILLLVAIIPVIALLLYIYKKDPNKETFGSLFKIFMFGVLSTIPAIILELLADVLFSLTLGSKPNGIGLFVYIFIGVALVEEFVKWFVTKIFIYNTDKFDEYYDAIVYCTYASLGFAGLENIIYVLGSGIGTGVLRAITSVPGHACFGIIMGYYLCYTKFNDIRGNAEKTKYNALSLLYPVIAHTLYDYFIFAGNILLWLVFYIVLLVYCIKIINKVAKLNQSFYSANPNPNATINPMTNNTNNVVNERKFCPSCGNQLFGGNFCPKCGYKLQQ